MNAVILEKLSKIYPGGKKAVDTVSLSLTPGEVFGFLGPNGAGKTTTVKLLNGMLTPSSGSCRIFGIDPARTPEKSHAISGVVTEHAQMYDTLTGLENLIFYGSLFGLSAAEEQKAGQGSAGTSESFGSSRSKTGLLFYRNAPASLPGPGYDPYAPDPFSRRTHFRA